MDCPMTDTLFTCTHGLVIRDRNSPTGYVAPRIEALGATACLRETRLSVHLPAAGATGVRLSRHLSRPRVLAGAAAEGRFQRQCVSASASGGRPSTDPLSTETPVLGDAPSLAARHPLPMPRVPLRSCLRHGGFPHLHAFRRRPNAMVEAGVATNTPPPVHVRVHATRLPARPMTTEQLAEVVSPTRRLRAVW